MRKFILFVNNHVCTVKITTTTPINQSINQYPCDHASGYCDVIAKWFGRSLEPGGRQPSGSNQARRLLLCALTIAIYYYYSIRKLSFIFPLTAWV